MCLPQDAERCSNTDSGDHNDKIERPGAPTVDSLSGGVSTTDAHDKPPNPQDPHLESILEPTAVGSSKNPRVSVPNSEEPGISEIVEASGRPRAAFEITEVRRYLINRQLGNLRLAKSRQYVGGGTSSYSFSTATIHGVIRRRDDDNSVDEEQGRTSFGPLAKRIRRTESEDITAASSMATSRASTPAVSTHGLSNSMTPVPRTPSMTHGIQRSSIDMIIEPDDGATPPPDSDERAVDQNTDQGDDTQTSEQEPSVGATSGQAELRDEQTMGETPIPPVQDLSLASPRMEVNPFTESRMFLHPLDVGRLLPHSPVAYDVPSGGSIVVSQSPPQEPPTQKAYSFSAAEIRTLVASRGSDESSRPNKLVFYLDWGVMNRITKWRNFKADQG